MRLVALLPVCLGVVAGVVLTEAAPIQRPIAAALHVHSTWSTGDRSLEGLTTLASARGIQALFLAENHAENFEYGLSPLRGLLRYRVAYPSILSTGPDAFLRAVASANARQRDVLIVPGVEVMPHYYWTGRLWDGTLTMWNAQKNVLALGLYRPEDYRDLPAVGNPGAARWSLWSLWWLSPGLLAIPGVWLMRSTRRRVVWLRHFRVAEERRRIGPGVLCLVAGVVLLVNNYPFREPPVSPYDADAGLDPYQRVVDFVAARHGIAVWSLPEARDRQTVSVRGLRATIRTEPYSADLLQTDRFPAFGGLYEDTTTFTDPGHGWDQLLLEYLHGRRRMPAWAVGEAAYHGEGQAGKRLGDVQTVILAERSDASGLLEALRAGRTYCRMRTDDENLTLDVFQVHAPGAESAGAGGGLVLASGDRSAVRARITSETGRRLPVEIRLVRSGSVVHTLHGDTPLALDWADAPLPAGARAYYRLEANGPNGLRLQSNPIFVTAGREGAE